MRGMLRRVFYGILNSIWEDVSESMHAEQAMGTDSREYVLSAMLVLSALSSSTHVYIVSPGVYGIAR